MIWDVCWKVVEGLGRLLDGIDAVRCMVEVVEGMLRVCWWWWWWW